MDETVKALPSTYTAISVICCKRGLKCYRKISLGEIHRVAKMSRVHTIILTVHHRHPKQTKQYVSWTASHAWYIPM